MDPWSTTEPPPLPKEILEQHERLKRVYAAVSYAVGIRGKRATYALKREEEVARANLAAFERLHGLTSSDPRVG